MYTYLYAGIFVVGLIVMMIVLTTKNKKMDRLHWSIVLLLQFTNLGYVEVSMAKSIDAAIMGNSLIYIGGTILPTIFVVSFYQSYNCKLSFVIKDILYAFSIILFLSVKFGSKNGLYFKNLDIEVKDRGTRLKYNPGIMFYVHDLYIALLMVAIIGLMVYVKIKNLKARSYVTNGYKLITIFMAIGYAINSLFEPEIDVIPIVYMISFIIAGICFKINAVYDVNEVVSRMQESSDLIHGYVLVKNDFTVLGSTSKAIEMIPELDGIVLNGSNENYNSDTSRIDVSEVLYDMISSHIRNIDDEKVIKLDKNYYKLVLSDCSKNQNSHNATLIFEITDVTARQQYLEVVENYNIELEREVEKQTEQIREIAIKDRVTKIYSTYGFITELDKKIKSGIAVEYDVYYLDIVRMGLYNRKYGNSAGDIIIKQYAKTLEEFAGEDGVVGRLGGNFFVAMIKRDKRNAFLNLVSGLDVKIETYDGVENIKVASITGVYEITEKDKKHESIMANISMAINIAKNVIKKPVVIMTEQILKEMNEQRQIQEMIPKCMERGEFIPFYQPKINSSKKELCGAEALARWKHNGELIPPIKFIPLLEQNEGICKLDFYILDYVCRDIRRWIDNGINPPTISVNFSRRNLGNPILAEEIYNVVKKYDIPAKLVQIEITETIDEYPLSYLKGVVEALQRYGLSAAIDDFGTGSSSINLIKEVSFDVLKIDKSFIDSLTEKDCKIFELIIAMANQIGAAVVTEGAETKEQVEMINSLGCDVVQGYYFDKPLPVEVFEQRLKKTSYE